MGHHPSHARVGNGYEAITLALLDAGAYPLAVNKDGETAEQQAAERAQDEDEDEKYRQRCRRCVELLQQPREPIPWSPDKRSPGFRDKFPGCRRKQVARISWPLMRHRIWNAKAVPKSETKDNKQIVKDEWLDFVVRFVREQVRPMTRVVAG